MSKPLRIAVIGLRHPHIFDLLNRCRESADLQICAICEADDETCRRVADKPGMRVTHRDPVELLATIECDAVAVGDTYDRRGATIIRALQTGRHVISDKPVCTSLSDIDEMGRLCQAGGRQLGCMFDLRDRGMAIGLRNALRGGRLGAVCAIQFNAQHPLNYGRRAGWYFEPGRHGGTLNDIAVHALDLLPWVTGVEISELLHAYAWNREVAPGVSFQVGAQCMFRLANGAGVVGDVSYLAPDTFGYGLPSYWELRIWTERAMLETSLNAAGIRLYENGRSAVRDLPLPPGRPGGYLLDFIAAVRGKPASLTTADVLCASRHAIWLQEMAGTP